MSWLQNLPFNFLQKKSPNNPGIDPSLISQQPVVLKQSLPTAPKQKTLEELEKEMEAEVQQVHRTYPHQPVRKTKGRIGSKIFWAAILVGVPVGVVWVANLPYPVIRRPVAQNAPILLLPSYMNIDNHYRQAITSIQQAEQLIENPTSPADLQLGEKKVKEAQTHLDALPIRFLNDWSEYNYGWYDWRFSIYGFNSARTKVGQLEAKVFQEKNAQTLFTDSQQALLSAKQEYKQAKTVVDKKTAIASWQGAIDQLEQISGQTLAGKTAQKKLAADKREFQQVVGLAAGNERIITLIEAAQQFSWQAAKAGQNPPHTVAEWEQVENLWQEAINRVQQVPSDDLAGYAEAQKLLATYKTNLGQVEIRRQAEQNSVYALDQAQREIESLLANANSMDRNVLISQLQKIINRLEKVQNGTTVYLKAQELLLSANNKLKQLQAK